MGSAPRDRKSATNVGSLGELVLHRDRRLTLFDVPALRNGDVKHFTHFTSHICENFSLVVNVRVSVRSCNEVAIAWL